MLWGLVYQLELIALMPRLHKRNYLKLERSICYQLA